MRAIILAGGYATRLRPLTDNVAKPLLPVGGRPMIDRLVTACHDVPELGAIHVVTNSKFAPAFVAWAQQAAALLPLVVHDDGTTSNDDRLGAIGDVRFVLRQAQIEDEDLIVLAGDNLFDFSLADLVRFAAAHGPASVVAVYEHPVRELLSEYGIVELDGQGRVLSFVEKPAEPASNLVATAAYYFHRDHVRLLGAYLEEGNEPDKSGAFVEWLVPRAPVYGYRFSGDWVDVGDRQQLHEADNRLRRREGLPERDEYSLDT